MPAATSPRTAGPEGAELFRDTLPDPGTAIKAAQLIREFSAELDYALASVYTIYTPEHAAEILAELGPAIESLGSCLTRAINVVTKTLEDGDLAEQDTDEARYLAGTMEIATARASSVAVSAHHAAARLRAIAGGYTGYRDPGPLDPADYDRRHQRAAFDLQHRAISEHLAGITGISDLNTHTVEFPEDRGPRYTDFTYAGARWRLSPGPGGWHVQPAGTGWFCALPMRRAFGTRIHPRLIALEAVMAIDEHLEAAEAADA